MLNLSAYFAHLCVFLEFLVFQEIISQKRPSESTYSALFWVGLGIGIGWILRRS